MIKKFLLICKCNSCNENNNNDNENEKEKNLHHQIIYPNHPKSVREQMIGFVEGCLNEIKRYFKTEPQVSEQHIEPAPLFWQLFNTDNCS